MFLNFFSVFYAYIADLGHAAHKGYDDPIRTLSYSQNIREKHNRL